MRVKLSSHLGKAFATNIGVVQGIRSLPSYTMCMLMVPCATLILCYRTHLFQHQPPNMQTTQQSMIRRGEKSRRWWRNQVKNSNYLMLNMQKTQYITVTKADSSWRSVKLLDSLLGSAEDIQARIGAANRAFGSISWTRHKLSSRQFVCSLPSFCLSCCITEDCGH